MSLRAWELRLFRRKYGEKDLFQPLTKEDKVSVVLYRAGIVISTILIAVIAYMLFNASHYQADAAISIKTNTILILLYASVGTSVFFIHLYIGKFHKFLKKSILCLFNFIDTPFCNWEGGYLLGFG